MPLESPVQRDGDMGFIGYASRMNPATLPAGMLQLSENMRLDRGVATTRKGAKRMASGIAPTDTPLTVPFILTTNPNEKVVRSSYDGGVFAAAVVRSPDAVSSFEAIILAGRDRAYVQVFDSGDEFSELWGSGPIVTDTGEEIVTDLGDTIVSSNLPSELSYPSTPDELVEPTDKVSMIQAFNRLYILREASINRTGWETKTVTSGGITVAGTTATVNLTAHGYPAAARVRIEGSSTAAFDGAEYDIATAATDSFTITVPSGTATDATTAGRTVRRVKAPLYWDLDPGTDFVRSPGGVPAGLPASYKTLRGVPWASYANGRLIVPDGRDSVLISDALDPNTFDPFFSSFRANQGSNDYLVAVQPWVEGAFLVFMRKSIWIAQVNQFASTDGGDFSVDTPISKLELLTDEVGCSARRSIAVAGSFVFFLSDSGVYRLDSRLDLKLRGDTKPLSDPIADQLQDIDPSLAANAVGLWHDNRYHLAVPYGAGLLNNNVLFIWSALNDQWETRDGYGFGVDDLLVATYQRERRVFASSQAGIIMLLNENEAGDDAPDPSVPSYVGTVPGRILTRRFGMGTMTTKRFVRSLADVVLPDTASITVRARTINPDNNILLVPGQTNTSGLSEDYTLKQPIRHKAHYCELEFQTTGNRPEIRNVSVEAAMASLPQTETRHAA
jgi:hypothetical protein